MVNPQDFFIEHNGKFLDVDGVYGSECVDVVKAYFTECLGIPPVKGNAIDYWTNPPKGFTKVTEPKPWDLVVFDYKPVGHIAVVNWTTPTEINCFSQNDPLKAPCGFKTYPRDKHILGYLRWPNFPPEAPRPTSQSPHSDTSSGKFIMNYTSINTDPKLLEQARQLLVNYSGGKIDCNFHYWQLPPIYSPALWTSDEQTLFLKNYPVLTPFCYLTYTGNDPGHSDARTSTAPGSSTIVTAAFNVTDPLAVAFEMLHGLQEYILDKGLPIGMPLDNYNPTEELVKAKVDKVLPYLSKLG